MKVRDKITSSKQSSEKWVLSTPNGASLSSAVPAVVAIVVMVVHLVSIGCSPVPLEDGQAPRLPSITDIPRLHQLEKVGPELRRHLLERGRLALQTPTAAELQLRPVTVVIQARSDISAALAGHGARIRSVTRDGTIVITADVPLAAIPGMLSVPGLEAIELAQPVPPADVNAPPSGESTGR